MGGDVEAAGDVLTGAVVAGAVDRATKSSGASGHEPAAGATCGNCGTTLSGAYCSACGQAAHIHRSLLSLGHDILHGVFHFEGRIWRTVPELFFHPGRLTRRYIDGERAKFVSPMALFLFVVFLMFAVFSFTGGALVGDANFDDIDTAEITRNWQAPALEATGQKLAALRERRAKPDLSDEQRATLDRQIAELVKAQEVMGALATSDVVKLTELGMESDKQKEKDEAAPPASSAGESSTFQRRLNDSLRHANENPSLLLYKLKVNGYKFSWALIPLSVPFLWLLFFWRRDIHLYDHAIFVTYSITFMMLLTILLSLAATAGVSSAIWGTALGVVPPVHMYAQLRGAFGLSRFGASLRTFLLLIMTSIILILFAIGLLMIGVLG